MAKLVEERGEYEVWFERMNFPVMVKASSYGEAETKAMELFPKRQIFSVRKLGKVF